MRHLAVISVCWSREIQEEKYVVACLLPLSRRRMQRRCQNLPVDLVECNQILEKRPICNFYRVLRICS